MDYEDNSNFIIQKMTSDTMKVLRQQFIDYDESLVTHSFRSSINSSKWCSVVFPANPRNNKNLPENSLNFSTKLMSTATATWLGKNFLAIWSPWVSFQMPMEHKINKNPIKWVPRFLTVISTLTVLTMFIFQLDSFYQWYEYYFGDL